MKKILIGLMLWIGVSRSVPHTRLARGIFHSCVFADEAQTGCATFSVLELAFGARGAAMGGAFCGLADDISAIWWNPAGLGQIRRSEAQLCHQEWFQGFRDEYGSIGVPIYYGVIGTGLLYSSVTGIEGYDQANMPKGDIKTSELVFAMAYATKVGQRLHIGLALEGLYHNLDPEISGLTGDRGKAIASDLGVIWKTQALGIGASLQNIGTDVKYFNKSSEPLPRNLKIGMNLMPSDRLAGVFDINAPQFGKINYHLGGEYWVSEEFLAIRAGYSYGTLPRDHFSVMDGISAGFGIKLRDIELDYAYAGYGELGMTHRINVNWVFGAPEALKTGDIIVTVVDAKTKKPLQAIVIIETAYYEDTSLTSPIDGKVELKEVPMGEVHISAYKDFYTSKTDTIYLEWLETAKVEQALQYIGPAGVPPEKVVKKGIYGRILVGKVTERGTKEPLANAIVHYKSPMFTSPEGKRYYVTDTVYADSDGWYKMPNISPGTYTITVESKNHDYFPEIISDVIVEHEKATLLHCTLKKAKSLNLFFETDRAYVHPRDFGTLDTIAQFMNRYKENKFEIHGHTDPRRPKKFKNNKELSLARAQAVADYLIKKGISPNRLTVKGWGAQKPIAPNDTEENMALNRRIEIIIAR